MLGSGPGDAAFRERLATMGVATGRLAAGDRLSFDGIRAEVRWPIRGEVPVTAPSDGRRVNDTSIVLDLRFGERRVLLTGDVEDDVDPRLLAMGIARDGRPLDVLKVAHHGSGSATSDAWLDALRPRVALVSAGTGNRYGHPAPRTLERLERRGVRVLRTDLDGDLEVSTDGHDLRVATSGGRTADAGPIPHPGPSRSSRGSSCARSHSRPTGWRRSTVLPRERHRVARSPTRGRHRVTSHPPSATRSWLGPSAALATIAPMSIPTRLEAAGLLLSLRPVDGILEHSMVTADVASFLAEAVDRAGHPVDRALVEAASLLHDLDKALPADDPLRALGHGHAGARWLETNGYPELAPAVDTHPVGRLVDQAYAEWVAATTFEQRLVAYADKRSQRRVVTLDERFARWVRKHPDAADQLAMARVRAAELEAEMCGLAGLRPDDVQRLPWAEEAVRAAGRDEERAAS